MKNSKNTESEDAIILNSLAEKYGENSGFSNDSPIVKKIKSKIIKQQKPNHIQNIDQQPIEIYSEPTPLPPLPMVKLEAPKKVLSKLKPLRGLINNPGCQVQYVFENNVPLHEYCICQDLSYGLNCNEAIQNPCASMRQQFYVAGSSFGKAYFIHCSWNIPYLKKCASPLIWSQDLLGCINAEELRPLVQ